MKKLFACLCTTALLHAHTVVVEEKPDNAQTTMFLSLKGSYEHLSGAHQNAEQTYDVLSKFSPHNRALHHSQLKLFLAQGKVERVISLAEQLEKDGILDKASKSILAQAYALKKDNRKARVLLQQLHEENPTCEQTGYALANAYIRTKNLVKASEIIAPFLQEGFHRPKKYLFHFLQAKISFFAKNFADSQFHITQALKLAPRFTKGFLLKGLIFEQGTKKDIALDAYLSYLEHNKDRQIEKKALSLAFALKRYQVALTLLNKNKENTADYHHDRALIYFKQKKYQESYETLQKALALNPAHQSSRKLLIQLFLSSQESELACRQIAYWIRANPYSVSLLRWLVSLKEKGASHAHITQTLTSLAKESATYVICFALADLLHEQKQYEQACIWYTTALQDPGLDTHSLLASKLHFQHARALYQQEKFGACQKAVEACLHCSPAHPSGYNLKALLLMRTENYSQALNAVNRALVAAPLHSPYLDTKGMALLKLGRKKEALACLSKARAKAPHDETIALHLHLAQTR